MDFIHAGGRSWTTLQYFLLFLYAPFSWIFRKGFLYTNNNACGHTDTDTYVLISTLILLISNK